MPITLSPEELLSGASVGQTADLLAAELTEATGLDHTDARLRIAEMLSTLVGDDENKGLLDRFLLDATLLGSGNPVVVWYCPKCHHVGTIVRDMNGGQTNLSLGEVVQAVLDHERDEH
jgi:hypothetical protein